MAGWDDIVTELNSHKEPERYDIIRQKYLKDLESQTGRNIIAYYSSWLKKSVADTDINDLDMNGFMNSVRGMDCSHGLDLILHTPGGSPVAAESIVKYLRSKFGNDIRVIIPHLSMSAGTMIACSAKEIIMGKQSSLGPIDPQFQGIPAYNIKKEFEEAKADLSLHRENFDYWRILLSKYPAAFVKVASDAIELSDKLVKEWLGTCMFDKDQDADTIRNIVSSLNEHEKSKEHGRHFDVNFCKNIGLKIYELEKDQQLQDAVLSVHHAFMLTCALGPIVKVIESSTGKRYIVKQQQQPLPIPFPVDAAKKNKIN